MRKYTEPTAKNLLRRPLVLGVSSMGLMGLAFAVLLISYLFQSWKYANFLALGIALIGYVFLRILALVSKTGWEEQIVFGVEKLISKKTEILSEFGQPEEFELLSPDTADEDTLLVHKEHHAECIQCLKPKESVVLVYLKTCEGAQLLGFEKPKAALLRAKKTLFQMTKGLFLDQEHIYSLYTLPVTTDPLWLFGVLGRVNGDFKVFVRIQGLAFSEIKSQIELSRKRNSRDSSRLSNIDSEITFEDASSVLQGLSRGSEKLVEISLVVSSLQKLELDPEMFVEEKNKLLAALSVLGLRNRFFRSHIVRLATAADLIPSVGDAFEKGVPLLKTQRQSPLYFSPQDSRLEALHWLVVGASGSGKSFFTGLVLKRLLESQETPMSVLFLDHNRSFRRFVNEFGGSYAEPESLKELAGRHKGVIHGLNQPGVVAGIELSDLPLSEKKKAAHFVLNQIEFFLKTRNTTHPVYLVLDECWNFMRDEPVMVQRAFREFRKLNGAAIAITQSLSDFLTDESGQSIFQNAPIRILLRQGEDVEPYRGILGLNDVELRKLRFLKQQKGVFSECLIKTPFLSRIGRLYPTEAEHELFRTDNIREEMIRESREAICV